MQITPSRLQVEQTTIESWIPRGTAEEPTILPTIIYTTTTALPAGIDSLLLPYDGSQMPQAQLEIIQTSSDGLDSVFKLTQGTVSDLFIFQRTAGAISVPSENVSFDGERLFLRRDNGVVRSLAIVNGSSLTVDGVPVVDLPEPQAWYAVSFEAGAPQVYQGSLSVDAKEEQP